MLRGALAALAALLLPLLAAAQPSPQASPPAGGTEPSTRAFGWSPYEEETVAEALRLLRLSLDPAPEGKVVESIETVRLEVIEERDPAPRFLNLFHVVTRPGVVQRELLLRAGDRWRQPLADESQRNLEALPQLSLVLVVPAKGSAPDRVRMVVITKDVWSLRLNWDIAYTSGGVESLSVHPTETNLLGTHESLGLLLDWAPLSLAVGAQLQAPRLLGNRVSASAEGGLIFANGSGQREGSFGALSLSNPLWTSLTEWSWGASVSWLEEVTRLYQNAHLAAFSLDPAAGCADARSCVPYAWKSDLVTAGASLTRSFGWATKQDLTLGFEGRRRHFTLPDLSAYDPATVEAFRTTRVPVSDDRVGPFVQYRTYSSSFLRVLDLETLALQEDHRLGFEGYARLYASWRSIGGSRSFTGISTGASHTLPLRDGLLRAGVELISEIEAGTVTDGSVQATLRVASPRGALGRLVLDGVLLDRFRNHLDQTSSLGGDSRLRGYPTGFLVGADVLAVNLEARSTPVPLFRSVQLGAVAFVDAGDAFDRFGQLSLHRSAGLGLRLLFPQVDRIAFRVDVGFPLERPLPAGASPAAVFVRFDQGFPLYEISPRTAATR
ncbi:BamA/TamA family outer membrane protein [Anaeromyxobacter paludicola]|uniref:Bacterial surface antigen (D15) domain-containing protein n=1 Tax=Anaeromyxobacter paludicola TaxID=2918171 RepID=A0ABM7XCB2_9BACT|nr:hypothetical protein [Anaeromyxobacter paludicola]BDG09512.1 hypothetical protein AMPC_26250 [Anaeromyxobacter paludicola]